MMKYSRASAIALEARKALMVCDFRAFVQRILCRVASAMHR